VREGELATWSDLASGERVGAPAEQESVVTLQNRCARKGVGERKSDGCMSKNDAPELNCCHQRTISPKFQPNSVY
jgi:hypothetical protein